MLQFDYSLCFIKSSSWHIPSVSVLTTITNKSKPKELQQNDHTEESRLLELIKRLSTDHVKMGANVSRYSSKGLSGRRSQSSGSICNGKGRHGSTGSANDKKICSSLPGYLDDKNKSCNNNLVCEKPPLDEVSNCGKKKLARSEFLMFELPT